MKYLVFIILLFFISTPAFTQINKGKKLVTKGDFEAAIEAFENDLEKETSKPISLQELAKIYFNKKYKGYDIKKAYQYVSRALKEYDNLNKSNKNKVQSKGLSRISMSKFQSDIVIEAFNFTQKSNNLAQTEHFLDYYNTAGKQQTEKIIKLRDKLAFQKASKENTFSAYESFFKKHEITCERYNKDLLIQAQKKLLESYIAEKGWQYYPSFEEKYRDNIYVKDPKAAYALIKIIRKNNLKEYKKYTEAYPHTPFNKFAQDYMFKLIMKENNLADYDYFVRAYPNYNQGKKIWLKFYRLYLQEHGSNAAIEFAQAYPKYPFQDAIQADAQIAQNNKDRPLFEAAKKQEDIFLILNFIQQCPSSPFVVDLEDAMYAALKKKGLFRGCKKFLQLFPNSQYYDQVLDIFYDIYVSDGELETINQFMMEHPEYKNISKQEKDLKLAEQGAQLNLTQKLQNQDEPTYEAYIKAAAPKERAFIALQRLIEQDIENKDWATASKKVSNLAPHFGQNHPKIQSLQTLLSAKTKEVRKIALGGGINSSAPEYMPLISMDNAALFFCRLDKSSAGLENENIYVSYFKDQEWQMAEPVEGLNTDTKNEGPLAISPDNQQMIIFRGSIRNGDMHISSYEQNTWSKPSPLPNAINTPSWDADGMISSNGNVLLYVSERTEVLGLKHQGNIQGFHGSNTGNRDIFVSLKNEKGQWQKPINLGDIINTPFAERTPFLHPDMKTLYFSSDGHGGLGHLDVYKTTRLDDTWQNWSTPINLGKSINTAQNDWGYRVSTDGKTAYYSSLNHDGDDDIYSINLPEKYRPNPVATITGKLVEIHGKNNLGAEIVWEDLETGKKEGQLLNNGTTGSFFITLPYGKNYGYFIHKEGYFPMANHIDLTQQSNNVEVYDQVFFLSIKDMVEQHISLPLQNIFFDNNKLSPRSYPELKRLAKLIKENKLTLTISGYSTGLPSQQENIALSENRANLLKEYLVAQGCRSSKVQIKGLGKGKPMASYSSSSSTQRAIQIEVSLSQN